MGSQLDLEPCDDAACCSLPLSLPLAEPQVVVGKVPPPVADNARGRTPTSSAIERLLRPSAASNTIRARFTSRCAVVGARQRASSTFRTFGWSRTYLALEIIPILNHD